jgi:hypothetical protein
MRAPTLRRTMFEGSSCYMSVLTCDMARLHPTTLRPCERCRIAQAHKTTVRVEGYTYKDDVRHKEQERDDRVPLANV